MNASERYDFKQDFDEMRLIDLQKTVSCAKV